MSYLNNSNLLATHQSAFRRHHSTEKAVTKVYSDILGAAEDGKLSLLILLDLSAVFDLVDHSILLKRLESAYGFDGLTLEWFKNYLSDRSFSLRCSGTESDFVDSSVGVPQRSVLGPLLFSLYTGDLERKVMKYKLGYHQYADDTQKYGYCKNEGTEELQIRVSECVGEIASWMEANCLKLNSEKTEVIWFSCIIYGNMALVSLPKVATQSIQSIINTTARLIKWVRKYDHITPVLKEFYWLKIDERIEYEIALQMYKCLSHVGPAYLIRDVVPVAILPKNRDWDRLSYRTLFPTSTSWNH